MATSRWMIASAVGTLMIAGTAAGAAAQSTADRTAQPLASLASFPPGSIHGTVLDERGEAVAGAVVSAIGGSTVLAVTDPKGHFDLRALPPGPYLVRAHLSGYVTPPAQIVQVRTSTPVTSDISLRRVGSSAPQVVAAGFVPPADVPAQTPEVAPDATPVNGAAKTDDETAWRIRHARRSVLKDVALPDDVTAGTEAPGRTSGPIDFLGHAAASSAVAATDFFTHTPFSGQVNLLTTSSADGAQLFAPNSLPSGIANLSLGAPVGDHADWTVRGALTQSDIAAWIVAGSYQSRGTGRHQYSLGLSYSAQRFNGGVPLALDATAGRSASEVYGSDTLVLTPTLAVTYGARYARYDYLDERNLVSPRVEVAVTPTARLRLSALLSHDAEAPGAEEFLPPSEVGVWLPPQRLFSSLDPAAPLHAEGTTHAALTVERDLAGTTISVRAFHQHVADQLATIFGETIPGRPVPTIGHYYVATVGDAAANGCAAAVRTAFTSWLRGSVEYSLADAQLTTPAGIPYLASVAPVPGVDRQRIHDVATSVETRLPETATRVLVFYRVSNGFVHPAHGIDANGDHPAFDSRFDVQVRQSLPFMNFTSAKWEMLLAVRNFFREPTADGQSAYDELLVVRPPTRIVGGLTMQF